MSHPVLPPAGSVGCAGRLAVRKGRAGLVLGLVLLTLAGGAAPGPSGAAFAQQAAGSASGSGSQAKIATLVEERRTMLADYEKAAQELRLVRADQKIAYEQMKISQARKNLGKAAASAPASGPDPDAEQLRTLAAKQVTQRAPYEKKAKDLRLRLRNNILEIRKLELEDKRNALRQK